MVLWSFPLTRPLVPIFVEYLSLDDQVIELGLTPNRADCLSIRGVARDVAVAFDEDLNEPAIPPVESTIATPSQSLLRPRQDVQDIWVVSSKTLTYRVPHPTTCASV